MSGDYHRVVMAGQDAPAFTIRSKSQGGDGEAVSPEGGPGAYNPRNPALPSAPAFTMRGRVIEAGAEETEAFPGEGGPSGNLKGQCCLCPSRGHTAAVMPLLLSSRCGSYEPFHD